MEDPSKQEKDWSLSKEQELRFDVRDSAIVVTLLSGTAEMFGTELARDREYTLRDRKGAIFTWHGCVLRLRGADSRAYVADETPMVSFLNVHAVLEEARLTAASSANREVGPKVMLVGPVDSGKSSLAKVLLNYGIKRGRKPIFIDLDVGQGEISPPGCFAANVVDKQCDIEDGWDLTSVLAFFYGHVSPSVNRKLYSSLMRRLAELLDQRFDADPACRSSGYICNTCGWVDDLGYEILKETIEIFKPTVVLVLGHERLHVDLKRDFGAENMDIVKLTKSGGVVTRDTAYRKKARMNRIHEYFYSPKGDLCPHSTKLDFGEVSIFSVAGASKAPSTALPAGTRSILDPCRLVRVNPGRDLLHSVLAVSHASRPEDLLMSNVAGFIYVSEVDVERQMFHVLTPCPGPLPSDKLLVGDLKWLDEKKL
eukprot:gnl/Hemi2/26655_TR8946_c0_g2_i1.p1 gnl/Hemi2/26655_TR8946_c0_g2~~gnl/Hemi2/26655_TR8946_c0_g2_i1.p1  ORF type:complete len:425 (+),score=95.46 gnl/Hemi2/26655_TR8946_c0_g2_i1:71-1345(+)